jgi:hypothetical protein
MISEQPTSATLNITRSHSSSEVIPLSTVTPTSTSPGTTVRPNSVAHKGTTILVTRENKALPAGCGPGEMAALLLDFFDAANRGDQQQVARLSMLPEVQYGYLPYWYGVSDGEPRNGGRHFSAVTRGQLRNLVVERHRQHERMRLLTVRVNGASEGDSTPGDISVDYYLTRQADDLSGDVERIAYAASTINCHERKIAVSAIGTLPVEVQRDIMRLAFALASLCPPPPPDHAGNAVIACTAP